LAKGVLYGFILFILVISVTLSAQAAETTVENQKDRNISINLTKGKNGKYPVNPVIDGESPTTGLPWTGEYKPLLVQIDNSDGGVGNMAPWGVNRADIVYEFPLTGGGHTRLTFLFSDEMPESVGPVRSARLGNVWLREEWDAGIAYYGGPSSEEVSIMREFKKLGATKKGVLFNGTDGAGKPWKAFYWRVAGKAGPHNVSVNAAGLQTLLPPDHVSPSRPFLFTDEPLDTGAYASRVTLVYPHKGYVSTFEYDDNVDQYYRFLRGIPYADELTGEPVSFSNIIVQRMKIKYSGGSPSPETIGRGNAEIFMSGRYIPGYWVRGSMEDRTIFLDENGNELRLQRGKTYVAIMTYAYPVTYEP